MAAGFGLLGLSPQTLWAMTPRELAAALRGRLGPRMSGPLSRSDLAGLLERYPDRTRS
ncbi:phage tail assembly chaperone [Hyphomicrobium sp. D-2]|uniref:phage tail assembly chaperone n=1 Tax=Hyphomicrobium sp. D-2 TaxID=3041621 RepID=UPI002458E1F5|nr:phage tail assembly chaperone [Hyphomicrobium sp. D-2]MDH4981303.1 phage tail assembly chaperone [Hyphomicrobium sp. D-2]